MKPYIKTALIPLIFYILMLCTVLSFWYGVHVGLSKTLVTNSEFIETKKDLKKSLKNQVDYIKELNDAFDAAYEIERIKGK